MTAGSGPVPPRGRSGEERAGFVGAGGRSGEGWSGSGGPGRAALLVVIFLLELALLAAAGFWGFTLDAGWPVRLLAGLGAPLILAVVWGLFCSPRATVPLPAPVKLGVQAACFLTGGVLLTLTGHLLAGAALVLLWSLTQTLLTSAKTPI
ncbi:YrdB family protein [Micromonospora sp. NPDC018662]|uniref:YrdB family protein n=1 Tax=Micromonospora sp. NPDC018662 TaxID=3364238 RepID=UPI0037A22B6F